MNNNVGIFIKGIILLIRGNVRELKHWIDNARVALFLAPFGI